MVVLGAACQFIPTCQGSAMDTIPNGRYYVHFTSAGLGRGWDRRGWDRRRLPYGPSNQPCAHVARLCVGGGSGGDVVVSAAGKDYSLLCYCCAVPEMTTWNLVFCRRPLTECSVVFLNAILDQTRREGNSIHMGTLPLQNCVVILAFQARTYVMCICNIE